MLKILVADDHDDLRLAMQIRLKSLGYQVIVAGDGREAIKQARTFLPDAILMDLNMPEIDGWQATCELRSDPILCSVPIIALTAYSLPGDRARAKSAGCDTVHIKPADMSALVVDIETLVAARSK